ncbi:hypothetical protein Tco_1406400 [Tanacetum coccineum]
MASRTVLTRSGPISINTARPINTVQSRTTVNNAGPMKNVINNAYSTARRPFNKITAANNINFTKKVNTVKGTKVNTARPKAVISVVKGNKGNTVKASACWVWRPKHKVLDHGSPQQDLKNKGVIDSGCSRHMTGNRSYLIHVQGSLTCLSAKGTPDEFNLWHRRLGHVQKHVMMQNSKDSPDAGFKPLGEEEKMDTEDPGNKSEALGKDSKVPSIEEPREDQRVNQELDVSSNNTNNINTASNRNNTNNVNVVSSTVNAAGIEVNVVDPKNKH